MSKGFFIAGTGTGVGKTIATGALLRRLRRGGHSVVTMKPIETGVIPGATLGPDLCTHDAAGATVFPQWDGCRAPYRYKEPVSPHLAWQLEGAPSPDFARIVAAYRKLADSFDLVLIEGAGGLLVPIDEERYMIDLVAALALPVLLVAPLGLGAINHTLLSVEALRNRKLPIAGIVLSENEAPVPDMIRKDNPAVIQARSAVPVVATLPFQPSLDIAAWERLAEHFDDAWIADSMGQEPA